MLHIVFVCFKLYWSGIIVIELLTYEVKSVAADWNAHSPQFDYTPRINLSEHISNMLANLTLTKKCDVTSAPMSTYNAT